MAAFAEQHGDTALMHAARLGHTTTVTELVQCGTDLNASDAVRSRRSMRSGRYLTAAGNAAMLHFARIIISSRCADASAAGWLDCAHVRR